MISGSLSPFWNCLNDTKEGKYIFLILKNLGVWDPKTYLDYLPLRAIKSGKAVNISLRSADIYPRLAVKCIENAGGGGGVSRLFFLSARIFF